MARLETRVEVFLQPGDLFVGDADYQIRTILGSCVSITLWHPALRIGGMSHFLLPTRVGPANPANSDGRYGDAALHQMLAQLRAMGVPPSQCQAKVFGGGNMFPKHMHPGVINVGQRNGDAARKLLQQNDIAVVSESLFGIGHRQIIFDISKGDVWAHQVRPSHV